MDHEDPPPRLGNADVLRRVLAGLRDGGREPELAAVLGWPGDRGQPVRGIPGRRAAPLGALPNPPRWAVHSVIEDGGVTHERVSELHPLVSSERLGIETASTCPTDVSVSVFDRPGERCWVRTSPTIQVEGGSYTLAEARCLVRAIEELLVIVS